MKQYFVGLFLVASVALLTGCGKYEEGPPFSLRSKNARLIGDWKLTKMEVPSSEVFFDGVTITSSFDTTNYSFNMTLEEDGTMESTESYENSFENYQNTRTNYWSWLDGTSPKENLYLFLPYRGYGSYRILKLTSDELIVSSNGEDVWELEKK